MFDFLDDLFSVVVDVVETAGSIVVDTVEFAGSVAADTLILLLMLPKAHLIWLVT